MRYIPSNTVNAFICTYLQTAKNNLLNIEALIQEKAVAISFKDFLCSQLNAKVIDLDYSDLICAVVCYKSLRKYLEMNSQNLSSLNKCLVLYYSIFTKLGIYLYLQYGVKLYPTLDTNLHELLLEICAKSKVSKISVNIIDNVVEDCYSLLREEGYAVLNCQESELDTQYLTELLTVLNYIDNGELVIPDNSLWLGGD